MNDIIHGLANLATFSGLIDFAIGFGFAYLINYIRCLRKHQRPKINWRYTGIAIGCVMIVFSSLQTQIAYNIAKETAQEVQDCQREFNSSLNYRAKINDEDQQLSQAQRLIVYNWIHDLIFPPEPYASMDLSDPRRQTYGITRTFETEHSFQASLNRQDVLQSERNKHPLPEPTCGK